MLSSPSPRYCDNTRNSPLGSANTSLRVHTGRRLSPMGRPQSTSNAVASSKEPSLKCSISTENMRRQRLLGHSGVGAASAPSLKRVGRHRPLKSSKKDLLALNSQNLSRTSSRQISRSTSNLSRSSSNNSTSSTTGSLKPNEVIQFAQRSNGSTVKTTLTELQTKLLQCAKPSAPKTPPLHELSLLAQWAAMDTYYQVIISKYHGIPTVVAAMKTFPQDEAVQVLGSSILSHLSNKMQIRDVGGVSALLEAMKNHPASISVQSEALAALQGQAKAQSLGIETNSTSNSPKLMEEMRHLLVHAKAMFLTKHGVEAIQFLAQVVAMTPGSSS